MLVGDCNILILEKIMIYVKIYKKIILIIFSAVIFPVIHHKKFIQLNVFELNQLNMDDIFKSKF